MLAITQLVIMSRIAATDRWVPALLWAGLLGEIVAVGLLARSTGAILTISTITAVAVAAAGLLVPLSRGARSAAQPAESTWLS